jgi:hypothetical protein
MAVPDAEVQVPQERTVSLHLHCLASDATAAAGVDTPLLLFDSPALPEPLTALAGVVAADSDEARIATLLERGAARVFVGDAALADPAVIERLQRFGAGRLGVYARARRMANQWSFDTTSNADFRIVAPSVCEPAWELLRQDGSVAVTHAHQWIERLVRRGARMVLVQADVCDDADLNLCAGLVERYADAVCFAPADDDSPRLDEWVRYGRVQRIALPPALYRRREALLCPADGAQEVA